MSKKNLFGFTVCWYQGTVVLQMPPFLFYTLSCLHLLYLQPSYDDLIFLQVNYFGFHYVIQLNSCYCSKYCLSRGRMWIKYSEVGTTGNLMKLFLRKPDIFYFTFAFVLKSWLWSIFTFQQHMTFMLKMCTLYLSNARSFMNPASVSLKYGFFGSGELIDYLICNTKIQEMMRRTRSI